METKTLIQQSANVLRITELQKGNVVKLIKKEYSSLEAYFGVVIDLLNSGKETYIHLLLFKKSYGKIEGSIEIHNGSEDLSLFPATIEEVKEELGNALEGIARDIEEERKKLHDKIESYERAKEFVEGETSKQLTEASFEELTIQEYKEEEKIKQIEAIKGE